MTALMLQSSDVHVHRGTVWKRSSLSDHPLAEGPAFAKPLEHEFQTFSLKVN